jgi:CHRD domain.
MIARTIRLPAAALVLLAVLAVPAHATIVNFTINLNGMQEVPPVSTPATGSGTATLNTVTGLITLSGTYSGLIGSGEFGHLHGLAPVGANGPVIFDLTVGGGNFSGSGTLTPAQVTGALNLLTYVNIHTSAFPGGEIRGQLLPEPSAAVLALAGAALLRRRRL